MPGEVRLEIYKGSISVREFRELRDAADAADESGEVTYLTSNGHRVAKIVPVDESDTCGPCTDGRHEDCPRHHPGGGSCGCDQRSVHLCIESAQISRLQMSRRRP